MADRSARNRAWEHLWKTSRVASCVPHNPATEQQINGHWHALFAALPDESRVLDIATGNGVVLRQAAAAAEAANKQFTLVGIDAADIDPLRFAPGGFGSRVSVRFIGGIDAASLPFDNASFDVVVSQYGLEYAQLDAAFSEVERVLCAGGWLHWLAHSDESEVVLQNSVHRRQVELLLARNGPLESMELLVSRVRQGKSLKIPMSRVGRALQKAEEFCRHNPPASIVVEVCAGLADTANRWQAYDPRDLQTMLENSRRELIEHRQRIMDLQDAVLDGERQQWLRDRLQTSRWRQASIRELRAGSTRDSIGLLIAAKRGD